VRRAQSASVAKGGTNCRGDPRRLAVNLAVREAAQPDSEHPERKLTFPVVLER